MKKILRFALAAGIAALTAQNLSAAAITTLPETAKIQNYIFSGNMFTTFWGSTFAFEETMLPAEMAYDGNDVYWKNPTQGEYKAYVKGVKDGNKITFNFPQQENASVSYNCMTRTSDLSAAPAYAVAEQNSISFTVQDDGHLVMNEGNEDGSVILGVTTSAGAWKSLGVFNIDLAPFNSTLVDVPASATVSKMVLSYKGGSREVAMGVDGNTYYLQGLYEKLPEAWVKGVLADGKVSFESGQYMGVDPETGWMVFLYGSQVEIVYSESLGYYDSNVLKEAFILALDAQTGALSAENDLLVCPGENFKNTPAFPAISDINIIPQKDITDFTPAIPVITEVGVYPMYPGMGWDYVDVTLSNVNGEGQMLDESKIYYRLFIDGKPYILDPDEFDGVTEKMEWIPFDFECYDLEKIGGTARSVSIYAEDYSVVGVQEKYVDGDKEYLSDIANWDIASVGTITNAAPEVVDEYYTDTAGRRVSNPANGFYIKTSVLANGRKLNNKTLIHK